MPGSNMMPNDFLYYSDLFKFFDIKLLQDIGLVLPLIVAVFAVKVATLMRGGRLELVWKLTASGMSVLALVKVIEALQHLGIFYVEGLKTLLELLMVIVFLTAFYKAWRFLVSGLNPKE